MLIYLICHRRKVTLVDFENIFRSQIGQGNKSYNIKNSYNKKWFFRYHLYLRTENKFFAYFYRCLLWGIKMLTATQPLCITSLYAINRAPITRILLILSSGYWSCARDVFRRLICKILLILLVRFENLLPLLVPVRN